MADQENLDPVMEFKSQASRRDEASVSLFICFIANLRNSHIYGSYLPPEGLSMSFSAAAPSRASGARKLASRGTTPTRRL